MVHAFSGFVFLLGLLSAFASNPAPDHGVPLMRNFSVLDYGAETQNWAVVQDRAGIMYFGNNSGLLIYDGIQWELVTISNHSMVNALAVDAEGRIYLGGSGEFGYLRPNAIGKPEYISLAATLDDEDKVFGKVWNIHCTQYGVFFRSREKFFKYNGNSIEVLPLKSYKRSTTFGNAILFNGRPNGLWVLDDRPPRKLPHTETLEKEGDGIIALPLSPTAVLLAVRGLGIFEYDLSPYMDEGSFKEVFRDDAPGPKPWENNVAPYLREHQFYTGSALDDGFALGTRTGGVVIVNRNGQLSRLINRDSGLLSNRVYAVHQDAHKNLWIALNNGLAFAEISAPFSLFPEGKSSHEGVLSIVDFENTLYIGAHNGLFYLDDAGRSQQIHKGQTGFWAFYPHKGSLITVSTELYQIENTQVRKIETLLPKNLTTFCLGGSPRFPDHILAGNREGIRVMKTETTEDGSLRVTEDFFLEGIHEEIRRIEPDSLGNLWLSTRLKGLIYLAFSNNDLHSAQVMRFGRDHGLPRLDSCKMVEICDTWRVATRAGVYRLASESSLGEHPETIRFVPDADFERFAGQPVHQIFEDESHRIWVSTPQSMGYFSTEGHKVLVWHEQPFKRIGEGYLYVAKDDTVWIDSPLGLYRYTGEIKPIQPREFQTLIRKVTVNDHLMFGGYPGPESKSASRLSLSLPPDMMGGMVSFDFSAAFYENSDSNRFRYFLEGYDKQWSEWGKTTHTNYTNLPGGTYEFLVESKNLYNHHGSIATVELHVPSPWYRTSVAYLIFGLGAFAILVAVMAGTSIYQKRRHERRRRFDLKQKELQKFEALGRLAGGIAHDFNGILATIYGFTHHIQKATAAVPNLKLPFDEIEKASKRCRDLVRQILAFSRGEKPRDRLLHASTELHKALDLAQITLPPRVVLVRRLDPDAGWLKGDPTRCHQVILNLFRNAIQALEGQAGTVEVGLERKVGAMGEYQLRAWVSDTGTGMDPKTRAHMFEPFYSKRKHGEGTGLGLWIVHTIVSDMGGTIAVTSEQGKGTLVELFFACHPAPGDQETVSSLKLPQGRGQRVLWIDSSKQRLREGILLLRHLRYKASGVQMEDMPLADFQRAPHNFDLVVLSCDENPDQGKNLLSQILKIRPDVPVLCWVEEKSPKPKGSLGELKGPFLPKSLAQIVFDAFSIRGNLEKGVSI